MLACSSAIPSEPTLVKAAPAQATSEQTIGIGPHGPIAAAVGETLVFESGKEWTVSFDSQAVTLVDPKAEGAARRFQFRALAAGPTEITFDSAVVGNCPNPPNCQPVAAQRIVMQLRVEQK